MRRYVSLLWILGLVLGCARQGGTTPAADTSAGGQAYAATPPPRASVNDPQGRSRDTPLKTCGPVEGYQYVANFRCSDGSMPLRGDIAAGQNARRGNVGSHQEGTGVLDSHIVDLYSVPCPGGTVEVFVCLYHCEGGRGPFKAAGHESAHAH